MYMLFLFLGRCIVPVSLLIFSFVHYPTCLTDPVRPIPFLITILFCFPLPFYQKEVSDERKMPVEASHRSSSTTSLIFPHDSPSVLPFDPQHFSTQLQHLSHDAPVPSMVGKTHRHSGNHCSRHMGDEIRGALSL